MSHFDLFLYSDSPRRPLADFGVSQKKYDNKQFLLLATYYQPLKRSKK